MRYSIRDFMPLLVIFAIICMFTLIRQFFLGEWDMMYAMNDFMAAFFIVFGTFKLINLPNFVTAYKKYDLLAARTTFYAYIYPFIEVGLGCAYLFRFRPIATNSFTYILMLFSAIGVANALATGKELMCACLGTVFKFPMTYVTLLEDVLMAGMSLGMLLYLLF